MPSISSFAIPVFDERRAELVHRNYAMVYGSLAGFSFSLVCWGYDALLLIRSHAAFPYLTWLLGMIGCTLTGLAAGWFSHKLHRLFASFIIWIMVGMVFSRLVAHTPFEIYSSAVKIFFPLYSQLLDLTYPPDAAYRMVLVTTGIIIGCIIAGLLINFLVDMSQEASAPIGAILPMILWIAVFALAAVPGELEINTYFRNPIVNTNQAIEYVMAHPNEDIDPRTTSETGYRSVLAIKDLFSSNRSLLLTNFQDDMVGANVAIDFNGHWALCSALNGRPSFCKPVETTDLIKSH